MTKSSKEIANPIENLAEGVPGTGETLEPIQPLKTTLMPAVSEEKHQSASETGMISAIEVPGEGRDDDEAQDASRVGDSPKAEPTPQTQTAAETGRKTPVILIVEDTTELAEVIQATLERMNMKTVHETHGNRAINALDEFKPDVVLLDISLPDMTGWKILDVIKEKHEQGTTLPKMPIIIVITAYGDPANRLVGKLQGVYSYLIKPFTADEVEQVVAGALSSAKG